jgi:hypothetical protein
MASNQEIVHKQRLSELTNAIRSKYQLLKQNEQNFELYQRSKFKPLLEKNKEKDSSREEPLDENLLSALLSAPQDKDKKYGLSNVNGEWYLGSAAVKFTPSSVLIGDMQYATTKGLISLLTQKDPVGYSQRDLDNYRAMLLHTKHHLTVSGENIKFRKGVKYEKIIKPLFPNYLETGSKPVGIVSSTPFKNNSDDSIKDQLDPSLSDFDSGLGDDQRSSTSKSGSGIARQAFLAAQHSTSRVRKICRSNHIPFEQMRHIKTDTQKRKNQFVSVYWNDPNELVERLHVLHMSRLAGNSNVDLNHEILAIENELREENYIC